ncbi:MAG TPA: hypothetical protein VFA78_03400 [Chloroflexota bacterium]|nr:hypothetical protein [Chloroflexota bacterium]
MALRFKLFRGAGIEAEINAWLEQFEPDVSQMTQTVGEDGAVTVSFLFEESFLGQEKRFSQEHGMESKPVVSPESIPEPPLKVSDEMGYPDPEL